MLHLFCYKFIRQCKFHNRISSGEFPTPIDKRFLYWNGAPGKILFENGALESRLCCTNPSISSINVPQLGTSMSCSRPPRRWPVYYKPVHRTLAAPGSISSRSPADEWGAKRWALPWRHKSAMASQITSIAFVYLTVYSGTDKKQTNLKAPRHWPLWGEFSGDRWIPRTKGQCRGKCLYLMTSSWVKPPL